MKYLLLMVLSFGVMAEDELTTISQHDMTLIMNEASETISKLREQNNKLYDSMISNAEQRDQFKQFLVSIGNKCLTHGKFVTLDKDDNVIKFNCSR